MSCSVVSEVRSEQVYGILYSETCLLAQRAMRAPSCNSEQLQLNAVSLHLSSSSSLVSVAQAGAGQAHQQIQREKMGQ